MNQFLAIGHRGAKGYVMENTITSIEYALNLGVNAIEIDVYRCASGEIIVFHDDTLERLSTRINRIEDLTLPEIQLILLHGGYSIPTLAEVIAFIDNRVVINIELKGEGTALGTFDAISNYIQNGILEKRNIIISSFHYKELRMYRSLDAEVKIGVLTREDFEEDITLAKELKAYSIHPYFEQLNQPLIDRLHQLNLKVIPFTINDEDLIKQYVSFGVDGIFCDYPDRLVKYLK
jgi:glycerophosphoryl diester phosphodiesterase